MLSPLPCLATLSKSTRPRKPDSRQLRSDIREADGRNGIDFDFAFLHAVAVTHFDMRARPYAHAAGDFSAANSLAQALGEHHEESLPRARLAQKIG